MTDLTDRDISRLADKLGRLAEIEAELEELRSENQQLRDNLDDECMRNRSITSTYAGMRTRLDKAFGAPLGAPDPRAEGRPAGLTGAVDYAIAEHARVLRELDEAHRRIRLIESD